LDYTEQHHLASRTSQNVLENLARERHGEKLGQSQSRNVEQINGPFECQFGAKHTADGGCHQTGVSWRTSDNRSASFYDSGTSTSRTMARRFVS